MKISLCWLLLILPSNLSSKHIVTASSICENKNGDDNSNTNAINTSTQQQKERQTTNIFKENSSSSSLDNCDRFKWRTCQNDADCKWEVWKESPYSPEGKVDLWQSELMYPNFHKYKCMIPPITGCNILRCVPDISNTGGHYCTEDSGCYDGQICSLNSNKCINCDTTTEYARAACHQVKTTGYADTPVFQNGQSGCAGDHCLHVCAYDTQCVRILDNTTEIDVTATHFQLPGLLHIDDLTRLELIRPAVCGGNDAGKEGSGMRCAGDVHRKVTSNHRTPDIIRSRELDVVELEIAHSKWEDYVTFDQTEFNDNGVVREIHDRGVAIGYEVPSQDLIDNGGDRTLGSGAAAYGLQNWHWAKGSGIVQCDVRYSQDETMHHDWGGISVDTSIKRSTLITRVCIRWHDEDNNIWCADWGTTSDFENLLPFKARCTLTGPSVQGIIPTHEQREKIRNNLINAYSSQKLSTAELLRAAFHDASTYHSDPAEVRGGAQGCMRFEHVHGNAANRGLAFFIDHLPGAIGCNNWSCPFSVADVLQYAGAVAVEYTQGPMFSSDLKWGRVDAGYIFCMGELQLHMPDANGGHEEGAFKVGSGNLQERLEIVFSSSAVYFENQLGLSKEEWVAFLGGGHSLGGVRGLITARNTRFNFDDTVDIFDNLYFKRLVMAKDSDLLSLCPQQKKLGHAHFWEPGKDNWQGYWDAHWTVLIDTDVSTTTNSETMNIVRQYAFNEDIFFDHFIKAYLKVANLGYGNLVEIQHSSGSQAPSEAPSKIPSQSPLESPIMCQNSPLRMKMGNKRRACTWVQKRKNNRCTKPGVRSHCLETCKSDKNPCEDYIFEDSEKKFYLKSDIMTCKKVSSNINQYCNMRGVSLTCRESCRGI